MLREKDYHTILDTVSTPIAITSPLFNEEGHIIDFLVEYLNFACRVVTHGRIHEGEKVSDFGSVLSPDIDSFALGVQALADDMSYTVPCRLPSSSNTVFYMTASKAKNNFCVLALTEAPEENTLPESQSTWQSQLEFCEHLFNQKTLRQKLRTAVSEEKFELYFQPQFSIKTGKLRGTEALLRWYDDSFGWIEPCNFIPVAEKTRTIIELGWWVLETAIATLKEWQTHYAFTGIMSVNVSPIQMQTPGFANAVAELLRKYDIKFGSLEMEITESTLIDNMGDAIHLLNEFRNLGILISLDDFGTGYSSFRYLQQLPVTTLKIDKSFIVGLANENRIALDITDAVVTLGEKLGLETIAEGVENTCQLNLLKSMNCKTAQGYLFGIPMDKSHCETVLQSDNATSL